MNNYPLAAVIGVAALLALVLGVLLFTNSATAPSTDIATSTATSTPSVSQILSFEACAAAGYPVMESHPRQCRLPDGRVYAEELPVEVTYKNASSNMIRVTRPDPGAVTGKTFTVSGQARGNWYFEASFPIKVLDRNGKVLVATPAQAQGEWMTTEFVPFSVQITVPESYIGPATLVLEKDNPSGLPEHDASLSIPITIEY